MLDCWKLNISRIGWDIKLIFCTWTNINRRYKLIAIFLNGWGQAFLSKPKKLWKYIWAVLHKLLFCFFFDRHQEKGNLFNGHGWPHHLAIIFYWHLKFSVAVKFKVTIILFLFAYCNIYCTNINMLYLLFLISK